MSCETAVIDPTGTAESKSVWPSSITLHRASRILALAWGDKRAAVAHRTLRMACRCAECENIRRHGTAPIFVPENVELLAIKPVGDVGLQFFFSDGHQRGIYPWAYLHSIVLRTE